MDITAPLKDVVDLQDWIGWRERIRSHVERARATCPDEVTEFRSISGDMLICGDSECWEVESWRRFAVAALIADWATYERATDQVDLVRLLFIMSRFSVGFRVWFARSSGKWSPVGYTAWYPFEAAHFERMECGAPALLDRTVIPLRVMPTKDRFLYLFNFSIVDKLRGTDFSKRLMRAFARELKNTDSSGLAAIAVSKDGVRVSQRFGMQQSGQFLLDGDEELILTGRKPQVA